MSAVAHRRPARVRGLGRRTGNGLVTGVMLVFGALMIAPIAWVVVTTIVPFEQRYSLPPEWLPTSFDFSAYRTVFDLLPAGTMLLNSVKITGLVTIGALTTSVLAAFAFARLQFRGRDALFILFLTGLMVPQQITAIPIFVGMRELHLVDTHTAVILPALVNALGIFLLRQYFMSIPRELDDATRIDGGGNLAILRHVILPLSGPAISAFAVFLFQVYWNDFFWPNVVLSTTDKLTLPLGLVALRGSQGEGEAVVVLAAVAMVVLPLLVLFLLFQRTLVRSVAGSSLKG